MALLQLSEKIRINFEDKTVHIRALSRLEELMVAFSNAGDANVVQAVIRGPRITGRVHRLNHTFSAHHQKNGAPAMHRIVLDMDWKLSGFNNLVDARFKINHGYDDAGKKYEHYVIELDI
jgi:hypothetical protein